ncbi:hypothetical protein ECP02994832_3593 [Escherichia coli P0299483.2]|nr:hypothetical protein ECP02994833_4587 [Escherichia coli P0299483.3]END77635.1 hypothetical protein ECP02994832_3593 [Escherichia coli P0299483.2]
MRRPDGILRRAIAGLNVSGLKKNTRDISLLRYMCVFS